MLGTQEAESEDHKFKPYLGYGMGTRLASLGNLARPCPKIEGFWQCSDSLVVKCLPNMRKVKSPALQMTIIHNDT